MQEIWENVFLTFIVMNSIFKVQIKRDQTQDNSKLFTPRQ